MSAWERDHAAENMEGKNDNTLKKKACTNEVQAVILILA